MSKIREYRCRWASNCRWDFGCLRNDFQTTRKWKPAVAEWRARTEAGPINSEIPVPSADNTHSKADPPIGWMGCRFCQAEPIDQLNQPIGCCGMRGRVRGGRREKEERNNWARRRVSKGHRPAGGMKDCRWVSKCRWSFGLGVSKVKGC
jgi:hypothetical protein